MQKQADIWKPSLISGAIFGVLSGIPYLGALNCLCCSLVMGAGALSAFMVIKGSLEPVPYGRAALSGLISGVVAAPFSWAVQFLFVVAFGTDMIEQLQESMEHLSQISPELDQGSELVSAMGLGIILVIVGFMTLALYAPFGALGGVIGRAIFENRSAPRPTAISPPPIEPGSTPPYGPPPGPPPGSQDPPGY